MLCTFEDCSFEMHVVAQEASDCEAIRPNWGERVNSGEKDLSLSVYCPEEK